MKQDDSVTDFVDGRNTMVKVLGRHTISLDLFDSLLKQRERLVNLAASDAEHNRFYLGAATAIEDYLKRQGIKLEAVKVEAGETNGV